MSLYYDPTISIKLIKDRPINTALELKELFDDPDLMVYTALDSGLLTAYNEKENTVFHLNRTTSRSSDEHASVNDLFSQLFGNLPTEKQENHPNTKLHLIDSPITTLDYYDNELVSVVNLKSGDRALIQHQLTYPTEKHEA